MKSKPFMAALVFSAIVVCCGFFKTAHAFDTFPCEAIKPTPVYTFEGLSWGTTEKDLVKTTFVIQPKIGLQCIVLYDKSEKKYTPLAVEGYLRQLYPNGVYVSTNDVKSTRQIVQEAEPKHTGGTGGTDFPPPYKLPKRPTPKAPTLFEFPK